MPGPQILVINVNITGNSPQPVRLWEYNSGFQISNSEHPHRPIPPEYQIPDTSWQVLKLIMGNAGLSNKWWGISK